LNGSNQFDVTGGTLTVKSVLQNNGAATGSLVISGNGTLTLAAANTYTGPTTVNAGTLLIGATNALSGATAVTVSAGAPLDVSTFSTTSGSLSGAGTVLFNAKGGTLITGSDNSSTLFSGSLVDFGGSGLVKVGTGALTFSGDNSGFGGTTMINGGSLVVL